MGVSAGMRHGSALAAAVLLTLLGSDAIAAIAFVKNVGTNGIAATGTTISVTVPAGGVAAGNTVIVAFAVDPAAGTVSCADTRGNAYSVDVDVANGAGTSGVRTVVFSTAVTTALAPGDTVTVTHPSAFARAISANEFSGLVTTAPRIDQTATGTGNGIVASTAASAPTTHPDELLFGAVGVEAKKDDPFIPGASYTGLPTDGSGPGGGPARDQVTIDPEYRIVAAIGSYVADGTVFISHEWAAALVTYKGSRRRIVTIP